MTIHERGSPQRTRRTQRIRSVLRTIVVDAPANPVAQVNNIEVDQESDRQATELQIGKQLGRVHRVHFFNGLDLDEYAVFNDVIDTKARIESNPVIRDRQADLALEMQISN